jgi:hypothetical protein
LKELGDAALVNLILETRQRMFDVVHFCHMAWHAHQRGHRRRLCTPPMGGWRVAVAGSPMSSVDLAGKVIVATLLERMVWVSVGLRA